MRTEDYFPEAADPAERRCEWCGEMAERAYEVFKTAKQIRQGIGTGQFLYCCPRHVRLGKEASKAPRIARRVERV